MNRQQRRASKANGRRMMKNGFDQWEDWTERAFQNVMYNPSRNLERFMKNSTYTVQIYHKETSWGLIEHLMVRRNDEGPVREWKDLQRIKNEIVGAERLGIEVFPPQSELVDDANMYHIWVLPNGARLPFGLQK